MKSLLLFATAFLAALMLQAQSTVTFLVNMQGLTVNANGVHIAGTFQSPQWQPGATAMSDTNGDGIYEYTTTVPTGVPIQFKFINGNNWGAGLDETVPADCGTDNTVGGYNRFFTPTTPAFTYGPVCFADCENCPPPPTANITFAVNMEQQTVNPNGVYVVGIPAVDSPFSQQMTDGDGDGVYTATLPFDTNQVINYRFQNGLGIADAEVVPTACRFMVQGMMFRRLVLGNADTTAATVCFAECADCIAPEPTISVTLKVNMSEQSVSPNGVHVMGNFQGWNASATPMTDADGDGVYEATVEVIEFANMLYKFINGNMDTDAEIVPSVCGLPDGFGAYNRVLEVGTSDVEAPVVCYGQCENCAIIQPNVNVTFLVNMSNETVSPDGVQIVGSMQNWTLGATPMSDLDADGVYEVTLEVPAMDTIEFVFINGNDWGLAEVVPAECGADNGFGGFNRTFYVGDMDAIYGPRCFGQCIDCEPIVEPTTVNVTFRVNMANESVSAAGVHIAGSFQGWTPGASQMTDNDGDGVYEFTAIIEENTDVQYKFLNGDAWGPAEEMVPADCGVANGLGGFNRALMIGSNDTTLQTVCFSSCADCLPVSLVIVTLNVDMSNETVTNDEVFVAGSFNSWTPEAMIPLGNSLYQLPIAVNAGQVIAYKFVNGTAWESVPMECGVDDMFGGYNRSFLVGNTNEEIPVECFAACGPCVVIPTVQLTLTVDMSQQTVNAAGVYVAGTFNGFSASATQMQEISPAIYRSVITVGQNEQQFFKFLNGPDFAFAESVPFECGVDDGFGGYNRTVTTNQNNITMPEVCFGYCAGCAIQVDETEGSAMSVYPNPTDGLITIEHKNPASLSVFNAMGELVIQIKQPSARVQFDTQAWSAGLYHVVLENGTTTTFIVR
ncbi:MAG: T9SS type A sorting domain-containing protein [Flavobacteriales bacterium]|jgi:hypothetical protein